jgi:ribosomal protein L2
MFDGLFYGIVGPTDDHPYGGGEDSKGAERRLPSHIGTETRRDQKTGMFLRFG